MATKSTAYYISRFNEIYDGDAWLGENLVTKLNDISDANAFRRPLKEVHCVAELVAHIIYWRQSIIKHLEGDTAYAGSIKSKENWPGVETLQKAGWDVLYSKLVESQQTIVSLLAKQTATFLSTEYAPGSTYEYLIAGIIDHDVYHLGQIGLVKKIIGNKQ
jgi:uncharacterized damage-inducible protein DinB